MPGRNINKLYLEHSYYHIYSRGVNKQAIFCDKEDYAVMLNLFKRYLSSRPVKDNKGRDYPWLHNDIQLLAFCLMPNHIHALIYQTEVTAITRLFKSIMTTYSMYFNKKYTRVGPLFQSRFRAALITDDAYLIHISRYIHLNPQHYKDWPFSSLAYYLGKLTASWVQPDLILELFRNSKDYEKFVADYRDYKKMLDATKQELA